MNITEENNSFDQFMSDNSFKVRLSTTYRRSKEDIWVDLQRSIALEEEVPETKKYYIRPGWIWIAASLLVITLTLTARFYSKIIYCPKGETRAFILPDKSEVVCNADTRIKYYPLMWHLNRSLILSGEAYFKVDKGSTFKVKSHFGTTEVIGTSFNLMARSFIYRVICIEGRVKVTSNTNNEAVIIQGQQAEVLQDGEVRISDKVDTSKSTAWTSGQFTYTAEPLNLVIEEIERQYNVDIEYPDSLDFSFTGGFETSLDLKIVLEIVCKPFFITFEKVNKRKYRLDLIEETQSTF